MSLKSTLNGLNQRVQVTCIALTTSSKPKREVKSPGAVLGMKATSDKPDPGGGRGRLTFSRLRSSCFRSAAFLERRVCSNACTACCFEIWGIESGELDGGIDGGATNSEKQ